MNKYQNEPDVCWVFLDTFFLFFYMDKYYHGDIKKKKKLNKRAF